MYRILDGYCGVGGASKGYHDAGLEVVGVDIEPQPDYPFTFIQGDAEEFIREHGDEFDAIHISPPCQFYSGLHRGTNAMGGRYGSMTHSGQIGKMRELSTRKSPLVIIENVEQAPLRPDLLLCGEMFGLAVLRHRIFETHGFRPRRPYHPRHRGNVKGWRHGTKVDGPYYAVYGKGGGKGTVAEWQQAMGIDWTDVRKSIAEAIPPAYTEYIGKALVNHLRATTAQVEQ